MNIILSTKPQCSVTAQPKQKGRLFDLHVKLLFLTSLCFAACNSQNNSSSSDSSVNNTSDGGSTEPDKTLTRTRILPDPSVPAQRCGMPGIPSKIVDCTDIAEGEDFYGQDGHYHFDFRQHNYTYNGDGTVTDNLTNLTWMRCVLGTDYNGDYSCSHLNLADLMTLDEAKKQCSILSKADGHSDWRVPTISELWSIQDIDQLRPSLDQEFFLNSPNRFIWSSTPYPGSASKYWIIYLEYSHFIMLDSSEEAAVMCVRGEDWPSAKFEKREKEGDEFVVDITTGLMWQKCSCGRSGLNCEIETDEIRTFKEALAACENLESAGFSDWRLPDRHELLSIIDTTRRAPVLDADFFPNTILGNYYSSTIIDADTQFCVNMTDGFSDRCGPNFEDGARCVRGNSPP